VDWIRFVPFLPCERPPMMTVTIYLISHSVRWPTRPLAMVDAIDAPNGAPEATVPPLPPHL